MEVPDKSAIFCPDADYDEYFTFWVGTTSGESKIAAIWGFYNGRYAFLCIPRVRIGILHFILAHFAILSLFNNYYHAKFYVSGLL